MRKLARLIVVVGSTFAASASISALTGCEVHETTIVSPGGEHHPAFLHALSDLRNARANVERRGGDAAMRWDERQAVAQIDAAINEIKQASIDDGKNLNDHPPVDEREPRAGRLHRARDVLKAARDDIEQREDDRFANGLKRRAIEHIDAAIGQVDAGINQS